MQSEQSAKLFTFFTPAAKPPQGTILNISGWSKFQFAEGFVSISAGGDNKKSQSLTVF